MEYIPIILILLTIILLYILIRDMICDLWCDRKEHYGAIIDAGTQEEPGTNASRNMLEYSKIDRESGHTYVLLGIDFNGNVSIHDIEREVYTSFKLDEDFMNWIKNRMIELEFIEIKHDSGDMDVHNVSILTNNIGITGNMDDMPGRVIKTFYYNNGRYSNTVTDHIVLPNALEYFMETLLRRLEQVAYKPDYDQHADTSTPPIVSEY